jgi:hypothetical protein
MLQADQAATFLRGQCIQSVEGGGAIRQVLPEAIEVGPQVLLAALELLSQPDGYPQFRLMNVFDAVGSEESRERLTGESLLPANGVMPNVHDHLDVVGA